jgi:serine/threonine protein phosphatase 1
MGNHEDAMLEFLEERSDGRAWLSYGGLETLMSYGVPVSNLPFGASAAMDLRKAVRRAVPATHVDFLRNCALSHTEGDFVFIHAGIRPGRGATDAARSVVDSRRLPARAVGLTGQSRGARAHHLR